MKAAMLGCIEGRGKSKSQNLESAAFCFLLLTFIPFLLHRAPESFAEKARRGAAWTPRIFHGAGGPLKDPRKG